MPVVPRFALSQDDEFVYLDVNVPYVRVSNMEFVIDGASFSFYVKPYLLKLVFPGELVDDDRAKGVYDPAKDNGTIKLTLPKAIKAQNFENLDLITNLRQPSTRDGGPANAKQGLVLEELDSITFDAEQEDSSSACAQQQSGEEPRAGAGNKDEDAVNRSRALLELEDQLARTTLDAAFDPSSSSVLLGQVSYGFNRSVQGLFHDIKNDFPELIELEEPDRVAPEERSMLRRNKEDEDFDKGRFLGDFFMAEEDPIFIEANKFVPHWRKEKPMFGNSQGFVLELEEESAFSGFSEHEKSRLMNLPNKNFLEFSEHETSRALCSILDVVIAYVYDHLLTAGDPTVESAWTIRTLSCTLSWLDEFSDAKSVVDACAHRMLAYPYIRHCDLISNVLNHVNHVFKCGRRVLLRCLIQKVDYQSLQRFSSQVSMATQHFDIPTRIRWPLGQIVFEALDGESHGNEGGENDDKDET